MSTKTPSFTPKNQSLHDSVISNQKKLPLKLNLNTIKGFSESTPPDNAYLSSNEHRQTSSSRNQSGNQALSLDQLSNGGGVKEIDACDLQVPQRFRDPNLQDVYKTAKKQQQLIQSLVENPPNGRNGR